jgi:hypothetical protein
MDAAIKSELQRLSIEIAVIRYDIREKLLCNTPLTAMRDEFEKLGVLQTQQHLLRCGRFEELPYPIQFLYTSEKTRNIIVNDAVHLNEFAV